MGYRWTNENCQWSVTSASVLPQLVGSIKKRRRRDEWKWKFWGRGSVPPYMYINVESGETIQWRNCVMLYFLGCSPPDKPGNRKKDFFTKQRLPRKSKHLFWANSRMFVQTKFYRLKIGVSFNFLTDNTAYKLIRSLQ